MLLLRVTLVETEPDMEAEETVRVCDGDRVSEIDPDPDRLPVPVSDNVRVTERVLPSKTEPDMVVERVILWDRDGVFESDLVCDLVPEDRDPDWLAVRLPDADRDILWDEVAVGVPLAERVAERDVLQDLVQEDCDAE